MNGGPRVDVVSCLPPLGWRPAGSNFARVIPPDRTLDENLGPICRVEKPPSARFEATRARAAPIAHSGFFENRCRAATNVTGPKSAYLSLKINGSRRNFSHGHVGLMMTSAIISLLVGMVLGQRFKFPVLMPTIAIALVLAIGAGIARGDTVWRIVFVAAAAAASLQ